jgi:hypothetical protein
LILLGIGWIVNRERLVSIEPVLKEFENLGILKIDAIEIKLL